MSEEKSTPAVKIERDQDGYVAKFSTGASTRNKEEIAAALQMQDAGYEVIRNGWPDFLAIKGDEVVFVEVKRENTPAAFSAAQRTVLSQLRKMGLNVRVMCPHSVKAKKPTSEGIAAAIKTVGSAAQVGIVLSKASSTRSWLNDLAWAIPDDCALLVPDTKAWNSCRLAQKTILHRKLKVTQVRPRGRITSAPQWEMECSREIVRRAGALIVIHDGEYEPAKWAVATGTARGLSVIVLSTDGSVTLDAPRGLRIPKRFHDAAEPETEGDLTAELYCRRETVAEPTDSDSQ